MLLTHAIFKEGLGDDCRRNFSWCSKVIPLRKEKLSLNAILNNLCDLKTKISYGIR